MIGRNLSSLGVTFIAFSYWGQRIQGMGRRTNRRDLGMPLPQLEQIKVCPEEEYQRQR
jgi:hypothetical protein